ncbi:MAG TPA: VWA domain-containing protein [Pyrinomonadaceae bacterium]|jgi:VWFA-related protein
MLFRIFPIARLLLSGLLCGGLMLAQARAQSASQSPPVPQQEEEVVRVSTELVQTDVMVFDKQGRFVDGLKPEQFELQVDGKPQSIAFFERITAGSFSEDAQLAAARGGRLRAATERTTGGIESGVRPLDRGRTIIFFVDDLHLAPDSVKRTRDTLLRFINEEMGQNDQAVVASASGQIGFLQQLTGEKQVLRKAVSLINYRPTNIRDADHPPMSEHAAMAVERRDQQVVDFYVEHILRQFPTPRDMAENMVMTRANQIIRQANYISFNTLATLEGLTRSSARLSGRKIVFFISDGFLIKSRDSDVRDKLRQITDAAARAGVVIYSLDARGLTPGLADATTGGVFDPTGRMSSVEMGERTALQDPLFTLASETGGRALVNTNALDISLTKALKETSVYYLLAWRPEQTDRREARFRNLEVKIKGRPDLKLMVRRGFFDAPPVQPATEQKRAKESKSQSPPKKSDGELLEALRAPFPYSSLPTALSLGFTNAPTVGSVLTASLEIDNHALDYTHTGGGGSEGKARADVMGAVLDEQGKLINSFKQELTVSPIQAQFSGANQRRIVYSNRFALKPGLYQVRVAARDLKSGRTGSAMEWIEIPDIAQGRFALSSIFVGERIERPTQSDRKDAVAAGIEEPVLVNAARRFTSNSRLRFILHIYNAARGATEPDVALQIQLLRDDQPVVTTPLRKLSTEGVTDFTRIPYGAEINLEGIPSGRYVLQLNAIDRIAKQSATRQINFTIE